MQSCWFRWVSLIRWRFRHEETGCDEVRRDLRRRCSGHSSYSRHCRWTSRQGPAADCGGQRDGQSYRPTDRGCKCGCARRPQWRSGHYGAASLAAQGGGLPAQARGEEVTHCDDLTGPAYAASQTWIDAEFDALDEILRGLAAVGELTPRISDMIVSYGERLSSRMIAE